jgi:hypothetical protein
MTKPAIKTFGYGSGTVEIYDESDDCLHCELMSVVRKFANEHPNDHGVGNLVMAIAAVIGDNLIVEGAAQRTEYITMINSRVKQRIPVFKELLRKRKRRAADMDEDCLHCVLKPPINDYCDRHPDGDVTDVLLALADVVGDLLALDKFAPHQTEILDKLGPWIKERIAYVEEEKSTGKDDSR